MVVDCAHGAASAAAPRAYRAAGARVIAINAEPNGLNINDGCGSTHMDALQRAVVSHGADLGLAHDGDADRCLAVDAERTGRRRRRDHGDAGAGDARGRRAGVGHPGGHGDEQPGPAPGHAIGGHRGAHHRVGDRYVLEELRGGQFALGGEQSGHIVMPAFGTTGDGIVTGLRLMSRMAQSRSTLATLAAPMKTLPQVLINVEVADKATVAQAPSVRSAIAAAEAELGDTGRILLRPSGTEQVVRVMVEAADEDTARQLAVRVAETVSAQN